MTADITTIRETIAGRAFDGIEQITVPFDTLTVKPTDEGYVIRGALSLRGLARTEGLREVFAPGAFDRAIVGRDAYGRAREAYDIRAFMCSNSSMLLGSTGADTLNIREEGERIIYRLTVPTEPYGRDLADQLAACDLPRACLTLRVVEDAWALWRGQALRTITRLKLFSVEPEVRAKGRV